MQIFIKTLEGKTITLDVERWNTIEVVKNKIQEKENIIIEKQKLLFRGIFLENRYNVADYDITKESTLNLILKKDDEEFSICVNILDFEKILIPVKPSDKIETLKKKILIKADIPLDEQNLFFCRNILENNKLISDYNIESQDIILCITFIRYLNINLGDKLVKINYNPSDTIIDLKYKIKKKFGYSITLYEDLIFNEIILEDNKTLKDYNIPNRSTIEIKKKIEQIKYS